MSLLLIYENFEFFAKNSHGMTWAFWTCPLLESVKKLMGLRFLNGRTPQGLYYIVKSILLTKISVFISLLSKVIRIKIDLKLYTYCPMSILPSAPGQGSRLGLQARALGQGSRLGLQASALGQGSRLGLQPRALGQGNVFPKKLKLSWFGILHRVVKNVCDKKFPLGMAWVWLKMGQVMVWLSN